MTERFAVLRPADPERARRRALELVGRPDGAAALRAIFDEQPHTFAGFVEPPCETLVDRAGQPVGTLEPGDSLVGPPEAFGG